MFLFFMFFVGHSYIFKYLTSIGTQNCSLPLRCFPFLMIKTKRKTERGEKKNNNFLIWVSHFKTAVYCSSRMWNQNQNHNFKKEKKEKNRSCKNKVASVKSIFKKNDSSLSCNKYQVSLSPLVSSRIDVSSGQLSSHSSTIWRSRSS